MEYGLILLAAGFGRRFGGNKLLYRLEGKPLYLYGAELLARLKKQRKDVREILAVTRYREIEETLETMGMKTVWNPRSYLGIASSLRAGLEAALAEEAPGTAGEKKAFCFFMGDQPYLQFETVNRFLDRYPPFRQRDGPPLLSGKTGEPGPVRGKICAGAFKAYGRSGRTPDHPQPSGRSLGDGSGGRLGTAGS